MSVISYVYHSVPWYMYTYTYMVYFSILSKLLHVYGCVKTMRLALVEYTVSEYMQCWVALFLHSPKMFPVNKRFRSHTIFFSVFFPVFFCTYVQ